MRDLRDFTTDRHRVVDDVPYGGGPGMVLKPEPLFRAIDAVEQQRGSRPYVVLTSPQGTRFTQDDAERLSRLPHLLVLCGRYEGVDERVRSRVDEEISIGDYVLSGGELPALVIIDAVARLVPGVVGDEQSVAAGFVQPRAARFSAVHAAGGSQRTAEADERLKVPDVLLSGNHAEIRRWRKREALARTLERRPDLLDDAALDDEEQEILRELVARQATQSEDGAACEARRFEGA